MTQEDIRLLYEYDRWANHRVLEAASRLDAEQFARDLRAGFGSVRDTLIHIIAGEWIWLSYWKDPPENSSLLKDLADRRDALFNPGALPTVAALRSKWAEVEKEQIEFLNGVTSEALARTLLFRTTRVSLAHLMQHVINHSTYHRGQIALMMRHLGAEPVATDFHEFLATGPASLPSLP
jgi:uncharacterized damage-inducible protein DinB